MSAGVEAVGGTSGNNNTGSHSFTVTAATKLVVAIGVGFTNADPLLQIATGFPKWNGVSMTPIASGSDDDNAFVGIKLFEMNSPATGTHTLLCDFNTTLLFSIATIGITGASLTTRTPSVAHNTNANPSLTVADTANGDLVLSFFANDNQSGASSVATGTVIQDQEDVGSDVDFTSQYQTAAGSNTVCSITQSGTGTGWAGVGVGIHQSTAITVTIGQPSETDTAQPMTVGKLKAIGQASETDTAQPMVLNGSTVFLDLAHGRELKNAQGVAWGAVTGWTYAWYDSLSALFGASAVPTGTGTVDSNASSEARVSVPGTTLASGQSGVLLLKHPNYPSTPAIAMFPLTIGP